MKTIWDLKVWTGNLSQPTDTKLFGSYSGAVGYIKETYPSDHKFTPEKQTTSSSKLGFSIPAVKDKASDITVKEERWVQLDAVTLNP